MKPKKNTRLKQVQVRNSSFSDNLYYSVIVRTCFQKDNYDSLIRFFILMFIQRFIYIYKLDQEYNPYFLIKREDFYGTNI